VKSNDLALVKLRKFGSNVSELTKLKFFFNEPITNIFTRPLTKTVEFEIKCMLNSAQEAKHSLCYFCLFFEVFK